MLYKLLLNKIEKIIVTSILLYDLSSLMNALISAATYSSSMADPFRISHCAHLELQTHVRLVAGGALHHQPRTLDILQQPFRPIVDTMSNEYVYPSISNLDASNTSCRAVLATELPAIQNGMLKAAARIAPAASALAVQNA